MTSSWGGLFLGGVSGGVGFSGGYWGDGDVLVTLGWGCGVVVLLDSGCVVFAFCIADVCKLLVLND